MDTFLLAFMQTRTGSDSIELTRRINQAITKPDLKLSESQVLQLIKAQTKILKDSARIEMSFKPLEAIVEMITASGHATPENEISMLNTTQELFYFLRNELDKSFSDEEIILMIEPMISQKGGNMNLVIQYFSEWAADYDQKKKEWMLDEEVYIERREEGYLDETNFWTRPSKNI